MKILEAINKFTQWKAFKVKPNTIYGYDGSLRQFCIFERNAEIENITLEDILEWLDWNIKIGLKSSAIDKKALAIKELLSFYQKQGIKVVDPDLVPLPQKDHSMPRVANDIDYYKILNIIPKSSAYYHIRNRAILGILHDTGARVGEIASLNLEDINFVLKCATIKGEKQRGDQVLKKIFWREETNIYLKSWLHKRHEFKTNNNAVFLSCNGGSGKDGIRRIDIEAIAEMLRKYSKQAGLEYNVNAHSFRHHLGVELAKRGANNSTISQLLGHKSIDSSRIYTIMGSQDLYKIYHKILGK